VNPWVGQYISSNNQGLYVKYTDQKSSATFLPFFEKPPKIRPLFLPAAEIFMGPLLCFAADISASWQHWMGAFFGLPVAEHCMHMERGAPPPCAETCSYIHIQYIFLISCACFGSTYTKIGTIQRRLAWPLRKDDTQNREAFHIF
jgi:hypothetical protein